MTGDTKADDDPGGARRRAAKHLEGLYGTVIAVGLGIAVTTTVTPVDDRLSVAWDHVPLLGAFLLTLVPFYHGALLHLDGKYGRAGGASNPTLNLLVDFAALFLEAVVVVALASSVGDVRSFAVGLFVLLIIDVLWASVARQIDKESPGSLSSWRRVNLSTLGVMVFGFIATAAVDPSDGALTAAVVALALVRSGVDYKRNWAFYGGHHADVSEASAT